MVLIFRTRYSCAKVSFLWHNALLYIANACLPILVDPSGEENEGRHTDGVQGETDGVENTQDDNSDINDNSRQKIWFLACLEGYRALAPQFAIAKGIFQRLVEMAIRRGGITAEEARVLMDQMTNDSERPLRVQGHQHGPDTRGRTMTTSRARPYEHSQPVPDFGMGSSRSGGFYGPPIPPQSTSQEATSSFITNLNLAAVNPSAASINALTRHLDGLVMPGTFTTGE